MSQVVAAEVARSVSPVQGDMPDAPKAKRTSGRVLEAVGPFLVFALFIGAWYCLTAFGLSEQRKFLAPYPHDVITVAFFDAKNLGELLRGLWLSTQVALVGLAIAIAIGMSLAVVMSQARWIERSVFPYAVALQAVPILAFVPLIGAFFDFNFRSRVIVCVIIALFPIIANTLYGLLSADRMQHDLFSLHGASRWTRLTKLQLPAAMPAIFTGFRISAGLSVIGAIVGDFFFRQGQPGVGRLIDVYRARLEQEEMYGAVILSALLGIVVFIVFGWVQNRVIGHWHESNRKVS
jgi:NitT/TauT family transport system permease protein